MKDHDNRVLLHICCGPCALGTIPMLKEEGFSLQGFYYNPNIHPNQEGRIRFPLGGKKIRHLCNIRRRRHPRQFLSQFPEGMNDLALA